MTELRNLLKCINPKQKVYVGKCFVDSYGHYLPRIYRVKDIDYDDAIDIDKVRLVNPTRRDDIPERLRLPLSSAAPLFGYYRGSEITPYVGDVVVTTAKDNYNALWEILGIDPTNSKRILLYCSSASEICSKEPSSLNLINRPLDDRFSLFGPNGLLDTVSMHSTNVKFTHGFNVKEIEEYWSDIVTFLSYSPSILSNYKCIREDIYACRNTIMGFLDFYEQERHEPLFVNADYAINNILLGCDIRTNVSDAVKALNSVSDLFKRWVSNTIVGRYVKSFDRYMATLTDAPKIVKVTISKAIREKELHDA